MKKRNIGIKFIFPVAVMAIGLVTGCGASEANKSSDYDMVTEEICLDDMIEGSLTDADKKEKYIDYLQAVLEGNIEDAYPSVKSAEVTLSEEEGATPAVISLELHEDLAEDSVSDIANVVATALGDTSTDDIIIQDSEGTILFKGK